MEAPDIEEVLADHRAEIMQMPGVTGVGMSRCDGEPCIKVFAREPRSDLHQRLERLLGDSRWVVEFSVEFKARPQADG